MVKNFILSASPRVKKGASRLPCELSPSAQAHLDTHTHTHTHTCKLTNTQADTQTQADTRN